jgi:hypothetical protein
VSLYILFDNNVCFVSSYILFSSHKFLKVVATEFMRGGFPRVGGDQVWDAHNLVLRPENW